MSRPSLINLDTSGIDLSVGNDTLLSEIMTDATGKLASAYAEIDMTFCELDEPPNDVQNLNVADIAVINPEQNVSMGLDDIVDACRNNELTVDQASNVVSNALSNSLIRNLGWDTAGAEVDDVMSQDMMDAAPTINFDTQLAADTYDSILETGAADGVEIVEQTVQDGLVAGVRNDFGEEDASSHEVEDNEADNSQNDDVDMGDESFGDS